MSRIISNYELDTILTEVLHSPLTAFYPTQDYFEDLYYTGCRSKEPLSIERWKYKNGMIILNTFKTEAIRFFEPTLLSNSLLEAISDNKPPYGGLTYNQLTAEFRRVVPMHPIYVGDRIADTYLFRYNRARQIYDKNSSINEVIDFFGWNSESIASKYVTTPLIYDLFNKT